MSFLYSFYIFTREKKTLYTIQFHFPMSLSSNDLFKKFKLKHHLTSQSSIENDDQYETTNSDDWTSHSTTPELDVDPHFDVYYQQDNSQNLLTPDIDELQRKENELVETLNAHQNEVNTKKKRKQFEKDLL